MSPVNKTSQSTYRKPDLKTHDDKSPWMKQTGHSSIIDTL